MSNLVNFIYDKTIDYIENRAGDNDIRAEYARFMSERNYNNNEMNKVVDVIAIICDAELVNARSPREEDNLIRDIIVSMVDAHAGAFAMSDKRIVDAVPDDIYSEMKRLEARWEDIIHRLQGGVAGRGRQTGGFGSSARRSVFDNSRENTFGGRSSVFDRDDNSRDNRRASNSVFSQSRAEPRESSVFDSDRESAYSVRPNGFGQSAARGRVDVARTDTPEPLRPQPVVEEKVDGPDYSSSRPYDNFWVKGENWQLAHKATFQWSWSPKQHTRRTYDPEQEVCFLVKGKDGSVREEFLAMTDDLVEYAHEIRTLTRPNETRRTSDRELGDDLFPSNDLDVVDMEALAKMEAEVRQHALEEFKATLVHSMPNTVAVANLEEAALQIVSESTKHDEHVVAAGKYLAIHLPGDKKTLEGLESLRTLTEDADLLMIQKRLKTLQGHIAENVMNYLDRHYTDEVNRAVKDQFGLSGLSITSFIEDFEDLINCKRFQSFGAGYAAQFLARTRPIVLGLMPITDEQERLEILECTEVLPVAEEDPELYTQFRENVVLMFKPLGIVHAKLNSDQLGMTGETVRTPVLSGQGAQPVLGQALIDLYAAGRKVSPSGHIYLMTADNLCYELVPISGARNIVGIRTA